MNPGLLRKEKETVFSWEEAWKPYSGALLENRNLKG